MPDHLPNLIAATVNALTECSGALRIALARQAHIQLLERWPLAGVCVSEGRLMPSVIAVGRN